MFSDTLHLHLLHSSLLSQEEIQRWKKGSERSCGPQVGTVAWLGIQGEGILLHAACA